MASACPNKSRSMDGNSLVRRSGWVLRAVIGDVLISGQCPANRSNWTLMKSAGSVFYIILYAQRRQPTGRRRSARARRELTVTAVMAGCGCWERGDGACIVWRRPTTGRRQLSRQCSLYTQSNSTLCIRILLLTVYCSRCSRNLTRAWVERVWPSQSAGEHCATVCRTFCIGGDSGFRRGEKKKRTK